MTKTYLEESYRQTRRRTSPRAAHFLFQKIVMRRSPSPSRALDEFYTPLESHSSRLSKDADQELPTYDPLSHLAKKERSRLRYAENAIHLIPVIIALCVGILWFFSDSLV